MLYQIKKIKILSLARIMAIICGIIYLIPTVIYLIGSIFFNTYGGGYWNLWQVIFPIFFPIGGAIAGFVGGLINGLIYNWVADYWGGIEMEIEAMEEIRNIDEK